MAMELDKTITADGFTYLDHAVDIVEKIYDYASPTTAIDIGAGSGRNARFLAEHGCAVTCVETGKESLVLLYELADGGKDIRIIESNLQDLKISERYDAVLCNMVLHFLQADEIDQSIATIKNLTAANGVVSISVYVDCDENASLPESYTYKFLPDQLKQKFSDWDILFYTEDYPMRHKKVDINGGRGYISARLISRKRQS